MSSLYTLSLGGVVVVALGAGYTADTFTNIADTLNTIRTEVRANAQVTHQQFEVINGRLEVIDRQLSGLEQ